MKITINLDRVLPALLCLALVMAYGWACERDISDREESRQVRK